MTRMVQRSFLATALAVALSCSLWSPSAHATLGDDGPHATTRDVVTVVHRADASIVTVRSRLPVPIPVSAPAPWSIAGLAAAVPLGRDAATTHPHGPLYARLRVFRL